jgi:hypothetical protein
VDAVEGVFSTYSEETHSKDTIALQAFPEVTIDLGNLF